jgi:hypothetical protein
MWKYSIIRAIIPYKKNTTIERMRRAINEQKYRITSHANEEMSEDLLELEDIEYIIRTGRITNRFLGDPRGIRYEVTGYTADGREASVVCRFHQSDILLIITAYA